VAVIRLLWSAGPDGIGHVRIGNSLRTGCGRVPVEERMGWPQDSRCVVCNAAAEAARPPVCPHCRKPMRREVVPAGA
jgi:hypothetical protein